MQAFDKAVGLRALDAGGTVLDLLELEEQLVGMAAVRPAAELAAVVAQDRGDLGLVLLKGRQHVGVDQVHGGDRHLVGVEPGHGVEIGRASCRERVWQDVENPVDAVSLKKNKK